MKYGFIVLALILSACSADATRKYEAKSVAVRDYCTQLCVWADKCGGFYPDACGILCTSDCMTACQKEVCDATGVECAQDNAPVETDEQIDECIDGVKASANDCTQYRPNPPGCSFAGI